jgi:hypothetical protein
MAFSSSPPMKSTFLLLLLWLASAAFAAPPSPPPPSDAAVRRVQSLYSETLPVLRLREVSLQEALDEVRTEWEKHHPKEIFPVTITDYRAVSSGAPYERVERITVDLSDIPYIEALQQLARLSRREIHAHGDIIQFESHDGIIVEDYISREFPASPELLAALGLKPESDSVAIRGAFERYGLEFNQYMKFVYIPSRQVLVAMCFQPQQEQIAGLLFLLRKGFHIAK